MEGAKPGSPGIPADGSLAKALVQHPSHPSHYSVQRQEIVVCERGQAGEAGRMALALTRVRSIRSHAEIQLRGLPFAAIGIVMNKHFDQDHLVVGLLTAA